MDFTQPVAFIVGVDRYRKLRALKGATGDADDIRNWLVNDCAVPSENITIHLAPLDSTGPYVPIGQEVHNWLDQLDDEAAIRHEVDFPLGPRVYVMFAGHGYNAAAAQQTAIFPRSTSTGWDVVPIVPIKSYLELSAYFREVVIISDACRDPIDFAPEPGWTRKIDFNKNSPAVNVFQAYAAKAGQKTKEHDFGGNRIRGVMTQAFLRGVRGAARDGDGHVTTVKLKNFMKAAVIAVLGEAMKPEILEGEDFVVSSAPEVKCRCTFVPTTETAGTATLQSNERNQSSPIPLSGNQVYDIPIGQYTLITPSGREKRFAAIWEEQDVIV